MTNEYRQYEVLQWAFSFLKKHDREEKVAEILLQHHLNASRTELFASMQEELAETTVEKFKQDVMEHATTGKPVQHLTGGEYFYGRLFHVNKDVLIPRFETEELVHHIIERVKTSYRHETMTIVDVGTGSGVIAITLALELPNTIVYATDISEKALKIAQKNAEKLKAKVHFLQGDFLQPIIEENIQPNIVVSNPPYIKKADEKILSDTVKNFDPHLALFAEDDGLKAYKDMTSQLTKLTKYEKFIYFEIGYDQASEVTSIMKSKFPQSEIKTIKDINQKDRIIVAKIDHQK